MDADVELATLTSLLDLDEFEVVEASVERRDRLRRFTLVPKVAVAGLCPALPRGHPGERHLCRDRHVADLPMGGLPHRTGGATVAVPLPGLRQVLHAAFRGRWAEGGARDRAAAGSGWRSWPATAT